MPPSVILSILPVVPYSTLTWNIPHLKLWLFIFYKTNFSSFSSLIKFLPFPRDFFGYRASEIIHTTYWTTWNSYFLTCICLPSVSWMQAFVCCGYQGNLRLWNNVKNIQQILRKTQGATWTTCKAWVRCFTATRKAAPSAFSTLTFNFLSIKWLVADHSAH